MPEFDLLVIGGGPGGYVAAIRAAQRGLRVGVVEKERPGGVCLNWGCIPTKAMLRSAEVFHTLTAAAEFGVYADNVRYDFAAVRQRKDGIVKELTDGVAGLLKANGVTVIEGMPGSSSRPRSRCTRPVRRRSSRAAPATPPRPVPPCGR